MSMNATDSATRLSEIGFTEFTASLINSTFDALIAANIRQMEAYGELARSMESVTSFILGTKDTVSGEDILAFLEQVLPATTGTSSTKVSAGTSLDDDDAKKLNEAIALPADVDIVKIPKTTIATGQINEATYKNILDAVAQRISANKYSLFKEMVRQGVLRLVVENGMIETRMTFSAWDNQSESSRKSASERIDKVRNESKSKSSLESFFTGPSSTKTRTTTLSVKTATESQAASGGTSINIFGGVRINFKTDYQPLGE